MPYDEEDQYNPDCGWPRGGYEAARVKHLAMSLDAVFGMMTAPPLRENINEREEA